MCAPGTGVPMPLPSGSLPRWGGPAAAEGVRSRLGAAGPRGARCQVDGQRSLAGLGRAHEGKRIAASPGSHPRKRAVGRVMISRRRTTCRVCGSRSGNEASKCGQAAAVAVTCAAAFVAQRARGGWVKPAGRKGMAHGPGRFNIGLSDSRHTSDPAGGVATQRCAIAPFSQGTGAGGLAGRPGWSATASRTLATRCARSHQGRAGGFAHEPPCQCLWPGAGEGPAGPSEASPGGGDHQTTAAG